MKKNKGFTTAIAILIVVAFVAIGGYFAVGKKTNNEPSSISSSESDIPTWKTYTNDKYGFEFKYYSNYKFKAEEGGNGMPLLQVELAKEGFTPANTQAFGVSVDNTKLNDLVSFFKKQYTNVVVNQKNINGNNFTMVSFDTLSLHMEFAYIEHNGFLYGFTPSDETLVFLDTFKFTK